MMPDNVLSTETIQGRFIPPDDIITDELTDYEMGGIAIQDPSQGLMVQPWIGFWKPEDSTVYIRPVESPTNIALFVEPNVIEFSFTFDQNMRWVTATRTADKKVKLRWFDATVAAYVISEFTNIDTFKLCLDDKREIQTQAGVSDVIFTYIKANSLYWRVQRDRYMTEYYGINAIPGNVRITNFGMASNWRLQWRYQFRSTLEI